MSQTVKLLFASALANALTWIILIPIWQYPDEQAHFAQIQYRAEIGGIPQGNEDFDTSFEVAFSQKVLETERDNLGNNKFTYHPQYHLHYSNNLFGPHESEITNLPKGQRSNLVKNEATLNPPLYYFLGAMVYKVFAAGSLITRVYAIRVMSSLIFLLTILVAFKSGQLIFQKSKILPVVLATLVAYKPMLAFASTGILPDALTNLLFTLFIYICIRIILENFSILKLFSLLVIIVLGALTRQHFLITLFIFPFVILEQFLFNKRSIRAIIISTGASISILYILGFFIGSLSYITRFDFPESTKVVLINPLSNLTLLEHFRWTIRHSVAEVWPWYWGIYKWLSLSLPPPVYRIINRLIPIATLGLVVKIVQIIKNKDIKKSLVLFFLILVPIVYFLLITAFDFLFRKNHGFSFGIQGRYFFPTILAQMALLLIGFKTIFELVLKRYAKWGFLLLVILIMVFNLFSLFFVSSTYYDFSSLSSFIIQVSQYKPLAIKGDVILVILGFGILLQLLFLFSFTKDVLKLKS